MTVRFEHETRIEAPVELVFDLSLDIDAHRASMSASNERAIAGVTSGRIGLGETVTWRARSGGVSVGPLRSASQRTTGGNREQHRTTKALLSQVATTFPKVTKRPST